MKTITLLPIIAVLSLVVFSQAQAAQQTAHNADLSAYSVPFVQEKLQLADYNSGRMRLLRQKTGMSADEVGQLYGHSGARLFGQFVCAILVAQRLGVSRELLLQRIRYTNIAAVLESMGVDRQRARDAIMASVQEMAAAEKGFTN